MKDHLSMFLKLRFHVLRCSRNGTFVRAFVNILSFLGLRQAAQCQRLYSTPATDAPVLVFDRSGRPSSPSLPRPPTPTDRGPRRRGAGPSSYGLWQRFLLQRPCERRKTSNFYKCTQKCIISIPPRDTKPEFRGHGKVVFHIALEFSDRDEPFVRKLSESGQIGRAVDSRRWPGMTTRARFHQVNIFSFGCIYMHFLNTMQYSVAPNSVPA